jgi:hypothetical protein
MPLAREGFSRRFYTEDSKKGIRFSMSQIVYPNPDIRKWNTLLFENFRPIQLHLKIAKLNGLRH